MFFRSNKFKRKNISHWFFTRKGGVSKGIYKSLNLGIGSKDNKANIIKNINIVKKKTNLKKIYTVKQMHSNKILELTKNYKNQRLSRADGIFTNKSDIGIGILTADCAPILFVDNNSEYICCIHSGWKGAYKNIIMKAIACYKRKNIAAIEAKAKTITAPIIVSFFEGQVILNVSCLTSCKNFNGFFINLIPVWQERRDSNPQPPVLETGALPIELRS